MCVCGVCLRAVLAVIGSKGQNIKVQGSIRFIEVQLGFHPLVKRKPLHLPLFIAIIIHFLVMMVSVGQTRATRFVTICTVMNYVLTDTYF